MKFGLMWALIILKQHLGFKQWFEWELAITGLDISTAEALGIAYKRSEPFCTCVFSLSDRNTAVIVMFTFEFCCSTRSQEWTDSSINQRNSFTPKSDRYQISPAAPNGNITSHSIKNLAFRQLLRWKMIKYYQSLYHIWENVTFWLWEWKG